MLTNNFSQIDIRGPLTGTNLSPATRDSDGDAPGGVAGIYGVASAALRPTGVGNLTVSNNTLMGGGVGGAGNANFPPTSGVFVDTDLLTSGLDLHVVNNFINGWVNAVSVYDTNGTGPGAFGNLPIGAIFELSNNDLSGNSALVVQTGAGELVNASNNWWGTNAEASVAALTGGPVDFTPYLNVGTDTSGSTGFQGSFSCCTSRVGGQTGATGRVPGRNQYRHRAPAQSRFTAEPIDEDVALNKMGVSLLGAGAATTNIQRADRRARLNHGGQRPAT